MYTLLLTVIYLAFISLGLPDSLLGSAWPVMQQSFDVPLSYAGIITMIISGGTILSSLLSERLTHRFGTRYVTTFSVLLTAVSLFGFSTASAFRMLCLWAIPYGLGAGAIDAALNNYVALYYSSRQMSWLHCFWGVGTIISPYIMSQALTGAGWQSGYRTVSVIQLCIAALLVCALPLWNIHSTPAGTAGAVTATSERGQILGLRRALRIRGVPCLLAGFLSYCAAEATVGLWASSYLVGVHGISEELAAAFGSLFYIGITVGRFLSGFVSDRLGDRRLIRIGTGMALVGMLCLLLPLATNTLALGGLVVIGLGFAPIYPSIIHATPGNFGARNSQAIIGIQMASAYLGSTLMPPLFGLIANRIGLELLPVYLLLFTVLMIGMLEWTFRKVANRQKN